MTAAVTHHDHRGLQPGSRRARAHRGHQGPRAVRRAGDRADGGEERIRNREAEDEAGAALIEKTPDGHGLLLSRKGDISAECDERRDEGGILREEPELAAHRDHVSKSP